MARIIKKSILITFTILVVVLISIGYYMIDYSLKPNHRGKNIEESFSEMFYKYPFVENWVDSLQSIEALKDTFITNANGVRLHGYYVESSIKTNKTALIIHGYTDNAIRMFMIGYLYNRDLNYNIVIPDLQFHGLSEGNAIQMGWKDRLDVLEWANVALNKFGTESSIVVHGISMGAATTMMLSGTEQLQQIKCYVEDCGYTSVWDEFSQELNVRFGLPEFPIMHVSSLMSNALLGWSFKEASALESIKRCNKPMLFIHGDQDTFVPTWMVYDLYKAKPQPKKLWIVEGAEHAVSYLENKEEYTKYVANFIEQYMN